MLQPQNILLFTRLSCSLLLLLLLMASTTVSVVLVQLPIITEEDDSSSFARIGSITSTTTTTTGATATTRATAPTGAVTAATDTSTRRMEKSIQFIGKDPGENKETLDNSKNLEPKTSKEGKLSAIASKSKPLEQPFVTLRQGKYLGQRKKSRAGRDYFAFTGIRYAKNPRRFEQLAEPLDPSDEVFNATSFGPFCLQHDWLRKRVTGNEDCLFINVYSPKLPKDDDERRNVTKRKRELLPVLMYFHGGAFYFGSGNIYYPDYFMSEDCVLLTMNYRLGVLGNMGLKDQVMALKWVQENIIHFMGDPTRVTVFGESAGGASVSYLLLSPMSQGLFQRGISHSGTALCPWAFVRNPRKVAYKLGSLLNCSANSSRELVNCLRSQDATRLVTMQGNLTEWNKDPFSLFAPTVERPGLDRDGNPLSPVFLEDSPYKLMCQRRALRLPWILGVCKDEGLLFHSATILSDPKLTEDLNVNWSRIAPVTFLFKETARDIHYVERKIKKFYFGDEKIGMKNMKNLTDLYSDRYFFHCTREAALLHALHAPTYIYQFAYDGKDTILAGFGLPKYGEAHGDDLQYFFPFSTFPFHKLDTDEGVFSQKIVKLWTSFAETGYPWESWGKEWCPISEDEVHGKSPLLWYNLVKTPELIEDPYKTRLQLWNNLQLHEMKLERDIPPRSYN